MHEVLAAFAAPWLYRPILWQLLRREILGRYRGSMLGLAWAFITPVLMLGVYTLVFVGVFRARWPGAEEAGGTAFALRLFAGLMVFNLFSEVVGRAASLIVEQPNLVKKVAFPLEILPYVTLGSALFHFAISACILIVGILVTGQTLPLSVILMPVIVLPLLPLLLGLAWLLSALGVYVRDIAQMVALGISLMLFLSPVFYSLQSISPEWQVWLHLNPLTSPIEQLRQIAFTGGETLWRQWASSLLAGCAVAFLGASTFKFLRKGFADVL